MLAYCEQVEPDMDTSDVGDYEGTTDEDGDETRKKPIAAMIVMAATKSAAMTILIFSPQTTDFSSPAFESIPQDRSPTVSTTTTT